MSENNVTELKETALVLSPPQLLEQAIKSGAGMDVIERLMGLQERWEATQARKAFNAAIAKFKADPPQILKTVEVGYDSKRGGDRTSYKHEDLAELLAAVDPALAAQGLWARFKVASDNGKVTVTCVIGHADGYSEADNTLTAAPDTSGSKNPVQAIGSAVSYLQRYTLKAALGLAAARDDDGRASGRPVTDKAIDDDQADKIYAIFKANPQISAEKFLKLPARNRSQVSLLSSSMPRCSGLRRRPRKRPPNEHRGFQLRAEFARMVRIAHGNPDCVSIFLHSGQG